MTAIEYIDFVRLLAVKHPLIRHDEVENNRFSDRGEKVFSSTGNDSKLKIDKYCVIISPSEFDTPVNQNDSRQDFEYANYNFEIARFCKPDDFEKIKTSRMEAKQIGWDFILEMQYYDVNKISPFRPAVMLTNKFPSNPTDGGVCNLFGYRYELTIRTLLNGFESHTPFTL